jgi:O-antigen/teichoic acid export membrane protein
MGQRSLTRNILSNWGSFVFAAVTNFFLSPIVVRSLGETQYGAWVLLGSMVGHLGLLDVGVRGAVTRYVARFNTSADHDSARRIYSSALRIFSIAGVVAISLAIVMAMLIGHAFNVPPQLLWTARVVVILGGINVALALVNGVFGGVLIGLERFETNNAIEIVISSCRAVAVLISLKTGQGLIGLALIQLCATLAQGLATMYFAHRAYPAIRLASWGWDRESVNLLFKYGLSASMLHVSSAVMLYSDSLIIGAFLPIAMVTHFSIAATLVDYARAVMAGITQTLSPRVAALEAKGQNSAMQSAVLLNARLASVVIYPIAMTFLFRGGSFVGLWMGQEFAAVAGKVLVVLSFNLLTLAGNQVVQAAMMGAGKHVALIPIFVGEAICNIVLSIVLVRRFGVIGTAFGTMIPRVVVSAFIGPWFAKQKFQVSLRRFWIDVFLRPALAIAPFAGATYFVERTFPAANVQTFFAQVFVLLPLVAIGVWAVCLESEERARLARAFGGFGALLRRQ